MSLEELRAQAEAEEQAEVEQPETEETEEVEVDETEAEQEEAEEPEAEETEESEDFELELEGESTPSQQKPDPIEVMQFKLSRKQRQKKEAEDERDSLREELEQLKAMIKGGNQSQATPQPAQPQSVAEPTIPDLYDDGINGDRQKYDAAMKKWFADYQAYQNRHLEAEQQQTKQKQKMEQLAHSFAERVGKFATKENIKPDYVADTINRAADKFDELTGIEGAFLDIMDAVGEGAEKVAMYLGQKENAMSEIVRLYNEDPRGFKVVRQMTEWKTKLGRKNERKVSKAPEPDQPLRGDKSSTSSAIKKKLQAKLDKAKTGKEMQEVYREARQAKVQLD